MSTSSSTQSATTLSKLIDLLHNQEDCEAIIRSARFLQKALDLLGHEVQESKLLELCKRFCDKGIYVEGDLSVLSIGSGSGSGVEDKIQNLNISKVNNLVGSSSGSTTS